MPMPRRPLHHLADLSSRLSAVLSRMDGKISDARLDTAPQESWQRFAPDSPASKNLSGPRPHTESWHESSRELAQGLLVRENVPREVMMIEWLESGHRSLPWPLLATLEEERPAGREDEKIPCNGLRFGAR